jgi:dTDP-glucose pyrophosphorylase
MAGAGSRFAIAGYLLPKPFIDVLGKPMIFWVIDNVRSSKYRLKYHFIVRREHMDAYGFEAALAAKGIDATFHSVDSVTEGAACSVLLAREHINNEEPLIVINSDQYLDIHIDEFYAALMNPTYDGIISCFWQPDENDLKWSYVSLDAEGEVATDVREKKWIGPHATTGLYGWKRGADFVRYAEQMIAANIRTNGEFYVAPVYNEAIAAGGKIRTHICKRMYGLGVPADLEYFINNYI